MSQELLNCVKFAALSLSMFVENKKVVFHM